VFDVLGNIIIFLSLAIATLALFDFYLSEQQKTRVAATSTRIWSWLDDMSRLSFLNLLRQRSIQWWIVLLACYPPLILVMTLELSSGRRGPLLYLSAVFLVLFVIFGPRAIAFALAPQRVLLIVIRAIAVFVACLVLLLAMFVVVGRATDIPDGSMLGANFGLMVSIGAMALLFLSILFLMIIAPLVFVVLARIVLAGVELTVRRIVEYPKGPILAGSAILVSIVAMMKAVG